MSNILDNSHQHTSSTNHLSTQSYLNNIDRKSVDLKGPDLRGPDLKSPELKSPEYIPVRKKYSVHSELQEYADLIEHRYKDSSDVINIDKDEELSYSSMTEAEITETKFTMAKVVSSIFFAVIFTSLFVITIPIYFPWANLYVFLIGGFLMAYFLYWFMFIVIKTRQFVVGPTTMRLYRPMIKSLNFVENGTILISFFMIGFSILATHLAIKTDVFLLHSFFEKLSLVHTANYALQVSMFFGANLGIYFLLKRKFFNKYQKLGIRRRTMMLMEYQSAAEVASNILDGKFSDDEDDDEEF